MSELCLKTGDRVRLNKEAIRKQIEDRELSSFYDFTKKSSSGNVILTNNLSKIGTIVSIDGNSIEVIFDDEINNSWYYHEDWLKLAE